MVISRSPLNNEYQAIGMLTDWFIRKNVDDTKYVFQYLLTVPLKVQTITTLDVDTFEQYCQPQYLFVMRSLK